MSTTRRTRPGRHWALAVLVGAGVLLTPLPALAAGPAPSAPVIGGVAAPDHAAQVIVDTVLAERGRPYVWGGTGPRGFDCSGLTMAAARAAGIRLPHSARLQARRGRAVSRAALRTG